MPKPEFFLEPGRKSLGLLRQPSQIPPRQVDDAHSIDVWRQPFTCITSIGRAHRYQPLASGTSGDQPRMVKTELLHTWNIPPSLGFHHGMIAMTILDFYVGETPILPVSLEQDHCIFNVKGFTENRFDYKLPVYKAVFKHPTQGETTAVFIFPDKAKNVGRLNAMKRVRIPEQTDH